MLRRAVVPIDIDGRTIPEGADVYIAPVLSHRLPALFDAPAGYHPDRYLTNPGQARHLHGFGGGAHKCLGEHFARMLTHVAITRLLQHHDLALADPRPAPVRTPAFKGPVPLQDPLPAASQPGPSAPEPVTSAHAAVPQGTGAYATRGQRHERMASPLRGSDVRRHIAAIMTGWVFPADSRQAQRHSGGDGLGKPVINLDLQGLVATAAGQLRCGGAGPGAATRTGPA